MFFLKSIACVLVVLVLGAAGGFLTAASIPGWYAGLAKPPGTPPNAVFGPVWSVLYLMMGLSFARIWHLATPGPAKRRALLLFAAQLILNLAWTPLFFGAHLLGTSLVEIVALWILILLTLTSFRRLDAVAGWMLLPYLLWVGYATYLNAGFWWLNRAS